MRVMSYPDYQGLGGCFSFLERIWVFFLVNLFLSCWHFTCKIYTVGKTYIGITDLAKGFIGGITNRLLL